MIQIIFSSIGIAGMCVAILIGMYIEVFLNQTPCILCFLQRSSMIVIALGLYWNVVYGVYVRHYAVSLFGVVFGLTCVLRHMALNVCKPVSEDTFFFACYRIYSWSFAVFFLTLIAISVLLFFHKPTKPSSSVALKRILGGVLFLILIGLIISSFYHKGFSF